MAGNGRMNSTDKRRPDEVYDDPYNVLNPTTIAEENEMDGWNRVGNVAVGGQPKKIITSGSRGSENKPAKPALR